MHTRIDSGALPVRHQTRRQGWPYTLVLTKTEELFACEKDARHKAMTDLAGLTSAWSDGSPGTSLLSTGGMMVLCVYTVYKKVKSLHLSLPALADECPEWAWYEES